MTTKMLRVDEVEHSKSGKSFSIKCSDGKYYTAYLDSGLEQAVGRTIEAVIGMLPGRDGKPGRPTIEEFSYVEERAPAGAAPQPEAMPAQQARLAPVIEPNRWWAAYVSNQCNAAIMTGLVKKPEDLIEWARFAKTAILSADAMGTGEVPF